MVEKLELAEPHLAGWLSSLGLGVEYVRSQGNTLFYRDDQGTEIPVLDLVGGYGSAILGHNNPEIVAYAKSLLDQGTPIHAQFSRHPYANDLAWKINTIIRREFGTSEHYSAVFANSGAEAVEVAVKHAELDRVMKLAALAEEIDANLEKARAAVRSGARLRAENAPELLGTEAPVPADPDVDAADAMAALDRLISAVKSANSERMTAPPVFLAPEGSFHGKLVGSIQLTHNVGYRAPFTALAAQCRFVPLDRPEALEKIVAEERKTLLDLTVDQDVVRLTERELPVICAFVLEPIQGEAGIHVLDRAAVRRIQQVCAGIDCPIIVDEVQSGMGRSGAFFASSHLGLQGDYFTLAKSLGGGIAKAALTLIRGSRYRTDFELVHSSTYAKDSFSTLIAGRTVDLLEADDGRAYRLAAERGDQLLAMLGRLKDEFGDIVKDVRGKGLMIGLEFHDQSDSTSEIIREQARAGLLGYLFAGYLLRAHAVRIFPTASATNTLRLEPSVHLTDTEIAQADKALRDLIAVLAKQDGETLLHA
ncbi:aspartate aminotransferase family protein [Streptomyces ipomoeae]|uniref:aspartate aminotransferase family protein n=1 Tax=Streptomyces ipomoeae TaxID=103232 RepID=UPI0011477D7E|nr:aminotransferase class III-fold pyridoxal phosphate-dependent enzyme [Streptomyces ipomoeae]MDX2935297.1 aminotransferase class III-fold pyridoxal phosphate-dependent enzyme [Streptomyces ipomoeae]TQE15055.1 aspartate aminotransferase family protein [Streptomyces ipomoeae]